MITKSILQRVLEKIFSLKKNANILKTPQRLSKQYQINSSKEILETPQKDKNQNTTFNNSRY